MKKKTTKVYCPLCKQLHRGYWDVNPVFGWNLKNCFYCGVELSDPSTEYDHFPIMNSNSGKNVVPACLECHKLRHNDSNHWPHGLYKELMQNWSTYSRGTRLMFAKMINSYIDNLQLIDDGLKYREEQKQKWREDRQKNGMKSKRGYQSSHPITPEQEAEINDLVEKIAYD